MYRRQIDIEMTGATMRCCTNSSEKDKLKVKKLIVSIIISTAVPSYHLETAAK